MGEDSGGLTNLLEAYGEVAEPSDMRTLGHIGAALIPVKWDRRAAFCLGGVVALLGAFVIAGWHAGSSRVVQLSPDFAPMQYNTALGFMALGAALCSWAHRRRALTRCLSALALAFGGATLFEYGFRVSLGIDTLFFRPSIMTLTSHGGRMSPHTAVCFSITGAAMILQSVEGIGRWRRLLIGSLAGVVLALAGSALLGYVVGIEATYSWGGLTGMAIPTALGFAVVSAALLGLAWASDDSERGRLWFAVPVGMCCLAGSLFIWHALRAQELIEGRREIEIRFDGIARRIEDKVTSRTLALVRMGKRWEQGTPRALAASDAELHLQQLAGLFAVGRLDGGATAVDWLAPREPLDLRPDAGPAERLWSAGVDRARRVSRATTTPPYVTRSGRRAFAFFSPLMGAPGDAAVLVALTDPAAMIRSVFASEGLIEGGLALEIAGVNVLGPQRAPAQEVVERTIVVGGVPWTVHVNPAFGAPGRLQTRRPSTALFVALALSAAVVRSFYLAEMRRSQARELVQRQAELVEHAAALTHSNAELDRFAYVASHDLRSPLRAIDNLAEWLQEDLLPPPEGETERRLSLIRQRVERMSKLLDDLLQYARAGKSKTKVEPVELGPLADQLFQGMEGSHRFELVLGPELPVLETVRAPLERVLLSLFENAMKHHDRQTGRLKLSAQDLGDCVEIRVTDDGPGIPTRFHSRIFEIFQTLLPRDQREASGMGLSISRKLVEAAGGTLTLAVNEGRGATFRFTWPRVWGSGYREESSRDHAPRNRARADG